MTREAFMGGWPTFATGSGPQLFPDVYWAMPADTSRERWVTLVPGKWTITPSTLPAKKPVNTDPYNVYYEISPLLGVQGRPKDLYWNPRTGAYVIAHPVSNPQKVPVPDGRVGVPAVVPPELQRRLAILDKLLADGVISQQLHDQREAELIREFT